MKFTKLVITNFMRFKGENVIKFSTLPEKNVTVVLGDNTCGKTTLAQAIRWCLYGSIISTQYYGKNSDDICLLNNDILADMTAQDRKSVKVEVDVESETQDGVTSHRIVREAAFTRKFPQLVADEKFEKLKVYVKEPSSDEELPYDSLGKDREKVLQIIEELFPRDLSNYFLFDGERWSDQNNTKSDIKDSIYTLVGISPVREMKKHLGEFGPNGRYSVIKKLNAKKSGSGDEYVTIKQKSQSLNDRIDIQNKNIEDAKENIADLERRIAEKEALLSTNPNAEKDQEEYKALQLSIEKGKGRLDRNEYDIVAQFSDSYMYFSAPLLEDVLNMLEGIDLKGVNLPGVTEKTIDTILQNHKCLCGHDIEPGSDEEAELLKLKRLVPPATIGTIVGNFEDKLANWCQRSEDLYTEIKGKADDYQDQAWDIEESQEKLEVKERSIDRKFNFAEQREIMRRLQKQEKDERQKISDATAVIESLSNEIKFNDEKLQQIESKDKQNQEIDLYMAYAKAMYESACRIYDSKEKDLLNNLNIIIEKNFREMFNEQEKYAHLDDDYTLHLYYKTLKGGSGIGYGNSEATGLSEGEKIARNFAFIVSILEYANKMKAEEEEEDAGVSFTQSMPLVLDGPFSKLSDVNTAKVAKSLPKVAEQVIIFMLDKDWIPSGLSQYTDPAYMYRVEKGIDENSSAIVPA